MCEARQYLCDCRLPNAEACLLSMSEFLNSDPHHTVDPLPFFYSLSLSPAPLSGVPAQRPSFAPTAFRPPCTGAPNATSCVRRPYVRNVRGDVVWVRLPSVIAPAASSTYAAAAPPRRLPCASCGTCAPL